MKSIQKHSTMYNDKIMINNNNNNNDNNYNRNNIFIEEREILMKVKLSEEIKNANRIMANHVRDQNSLTEITHAVYAMPRAMKIRLEIKRPLRKEKKAKKIEE